MQPDLLSPKQSLNKAYLKAKVARASMELFINSNWDLDISKYLRAWKRY